jgi:DnaD/phage-associated family protein
MSGLIVGLVLRLPITEEFNSEAKFIATVYADHAWEDGSHAYPAVETVAKHTGFSTRTVQRYLRLLEKTLLVQDGKGPRGTNRYKFALRETQDGSVGLIVRGGDSLTPRQPDGGDRESGDRESGDTSVTQTNNPSLVLVVNDTEFSKVAKFYESEIGAITPLVADAIRDACKEYPADWIPEAISIAVESNARRWNYVLAILKNCKAAGKRPSLNKLEAKHGTNRTGSKSNAKPKQAAKPAYSDADRAAAELVRKRQQA